MNPEMLKHFFEDDDIESKKENYIEYLSNRPGAVKEFGSMHGLFSTGDSEINLECVMDQVATHEAPVWISVKERDEWSSLAEFLGEMIAKYADVIDFDSLPDPDKYLMSRSLQDGYRTYFRQKGKTKEFCLEFVYAP